MSKDAYWFRHDANARNDPKMCRLLMIGGQAAKGSYWDIVEILRESDDYKISIETIDAVMFACRMPSDVIDQMVEVGLISKDDTHIWSESLMRRMANYNELLEKRRNAGRKGGEKKSVASAKQVLSKCQASAKQVLSKPEANAIAKPSDRSRVERSRVDPSREDPPGVKTLEQVDAGATPVAVPKRKLAKKTKKAESKSGPTFVAYSEAYEQRYGTKPIRNAKSNAMCKQLVDRLGASESPEVARWYLQSNNSFYVARGHSLGVLVGDAEKIRTEWATGRQTTQASAREGDRLQTQKTVWEKLAEQQETGGQHDA